MPLSDEDKARLVRLADILGRASLDEIIEGVRATLIDISLQVTSGSVSEAAHLLGTYERKIRRHNELLGIDINRYRRMDQDETA